MSKSARRSLLETFELVDCDLIANDRLRWTVEEMHRRGKDGGLRDFKQKLAVDYYGATAATFLEVFHRAVGVSFATYRNRLLVISGQVDPVEEDARRAISEIGFRAPEYLKSAQIVRKMGYNSLRAVNYRLEESVGMTLSQLIEYMRQEKILEMIAQGEPEREISRQTGLIGGFGAYVTKHFGKSFEELSSVVKGAEEGFKPEDFRL